MCNHDIIVSVKDGLVITSCRLCGAILDTKPANNQNVKPQEPWSEGLIKDNGGQILHD